MNTLLSSSESCLFLSDSVSLVAEGLVSGIICAHHHRCCKVSLGALQDGNALRGLCVAALPRVPPPLQARLCLV